MKKVLVRIRIKSNNNRFDNKDAGNENENYNNYESYDNDGNNDKVC